MLLNIRGFVFSESEGFEDMEGSNSLACNLVFGPIIAEYRNSFYAFSDRICMFLNG